VLQRKILARRTALAMLASWPATWPAAHATEQQSSLSRQAAALRQANFVDAKGSVHRLADLTAPLVLVNLWASWCPGCLTELPTICALIQQLNPGAIDVVMLSHAMNWSGDLTYARRTAVPFRHWRLGPHAPDSLTEAAFRVEDGRFGLPQSAVLAGPNRVLIDAALGSRDWSAPGQVRLAREWLTAVDE
jgi:thiol-disulfide isomerase/thioredoxin